MKCPRCRRGTVVGPRLMTVDEGDVMAQWCSRDGCDYYQAEPHLPSPQLSDALRGHVRSDRDHAARGQRLMANAADMLREHRHRIRLLEDTLATARATIDRHIKDGSGDLASVSQTISDIFSGKIKPVTAEPAHPLFGEDRSNG